VKLGLSVFKEMIQGAVPEVAMSQMGMGRKMVVPVWGAMISPSNHSRSASYRAGLPSPPTMVATVACTPNNPAWHRLPPRDRHRTDYQTDSRAGVRRFGFPVGTARETLFLRRDRLLAGQRPCQ
jgi:hypothetical protein